MSRKVLKPSILCMGILLACVVSIPAQETVLSIDFSEAQGYSNGPLLGQPAGGAEVWSAEPGTTPMGFDVIDGVLHVDQHGDVNSFITLKFPIIESGIIIVTWEWQYLGPPDLSVDNGFVISDSSNFDLDGDGGAVDFNENGAMTRMTATSGMLNSVNSDGAGTGTYADLGIDYRDGRLIPMKWEIDLDNLYYDVYVEGVLAADNFGFRRNPQQGFDTLVLWNSGSDVHFEDEGMNLDNIVISIGGTTAVQDWPLYQ